MFLVTSSTLKWYHRIFINVLKTGPIPQHIAFIMDGNRRYAKIKNAAIDVGHSKGYDKISDILFWCEKLGIHEVTVYAFSIENFKRTKQEVDTLFSLTSEKLKEMLESIDKMRAKGICVRFFGNYTLLPQELVALMAKIMLATKNNNKFILNIAFAYSSQDEIANAFQYISQGTRSEDITVDDINENLITKCMYSGKSRKLDVLVRTSGEMRFSDFMMWQSYNTNVMFDTVLWPNFSIYHMLSCVFKYQMCYANQRMVDKLLDLEEQTYSEKAKLFLQKIEEKRTSELIVFAQK